LVWLAKDWDIIPRERNTIKGDIHLTDHHSQRSLIKYKMHTDANTGLGFLLTLLGCQDFELKKRLEQTKECAAKVAATSLPFAKAWLALITRILPKVTYLMMLTRFTKQQLHMLAVVLDNVMLPNLGVNRKMKRAVVYNPLDLGGMEHPSIGTIQDKKGIGHLVRHPRWGKEIGQDLKILILQAQLLYGLIKPILEHPEMEMHHLEP